MVNQCVGVTDASAQVSTVCNAFDVDGLDMTSAQISTVCDAFDVDGFNTTSARVSTVCDALDVDGFNTSARVSTVPDAFMLMGVRHDISMDQYCL